MCCVWCINAGFIAGCGIVKYGMGVSPAVCILVLLQAVFFCGIVCGLKVVNSLGISILKVLVHPFKMSPQLYQLFGGMTQTSVSSKLANFTDWLTRVLLHTLDICTPNSSRLARHD